MGLFSKKPKEELLPDLPEPQGLGSPRMPDLPIVEESYPPQFSPPSNIQPPNQNLNSLPEPNRNYLEQQTIKQEISPKTNTQMQRSNFNISPSNNPGLMPPPQRNIPQPFPTHLIAEPVGNFNYQSPKRAHKKSQKNDDPVFVRLDRFESSLTTLEEIKEKVLEIEKILADTKRVKEKEERELEEWERNINIIKSKLESIDENIFNEIE